MKNTCTKCQQEMELHYETVTHTLGKREISVHHVPLYVCPSCQQSSYVMSQRLEWQLEEAYRHHQTEIFFKGE
ncbi:hypothetical protein CN918_31815 [Priestia megaterium]|nr:hypothetical protein CN918_31815 [Priestia megaterium]